MGHVSAMDVLEFHTDQTDRPASDMSDVLDVMRRSMPPPMVEPDDEAAEAQLGHPSADEPKARATWLDAIPNDGEDFDSSMLERTAAVDADDNGLYRMFRNLAH